MCKKLGIVNCLCSRLIIIYWEFSPPHMPLLSEELLTAISTAALQDDVKEFPTSLGLLLRTLFQTWELSD